MFKLNFRLLKYFKFQETIFWHAGGTSFYDLFSTRQNIHGTRTDYLCKNMAFLYLHHVHVTVCTKEAITMKHFLFVVSNSGCFM